MNKSSISLFAISFLVLFVFSSTILINDAIAQTEDSKIPNWVKGIFSFYTDGSIGDDELIGALQFLITSGMIDIGSQTDSNDMKTEISDLRQEMAKLQDERKIFLGPHDSLDEFMKSQEEIATKNGLQLSEMSKEANDAKQRVITLEKDLGEYVDGYWDSQEKITDLESEIEKLKSQIEELKNQ